MPTNRIVVLLTLFYLTLAQPVSTNAQLIFSEAFGEGDDAVSGTDDLGGVSWETDCPECIGDGDFFKIQSGQMVGQDTNGPATLESESIDISSCDFIEIEFDLWEEGTMEGCGTGCNSVDWVILEFNIDGAGWEVPDDAYFCDGPCADVMVIQADDIAGGYMHYSTGCIAAGDELQIRITVQAWASSERWIIDDLEVSCTDGPDIDAGEDQIVCEGETVILIGDNPDGADLEWDHDVTDGTPFLPEPGTEDYVVSATLGACTATDTVLVTVLDAPTVVVDPAGPYTTASGLQTMEATPPGGIWSADCGACIDPVTGEFDPEVAGVGTWEICYTAGDDPCATTECIDVVVTSGDCELTGVVSFNHPTCFGFTDGSVTINMTGTTGEVTYVITNEAGEIINVDNSNTANTLGEGWYYFNVSDEFPCTHIDSVYLDDPDEMTVDLETSNPLCYNDYSGFAFVDSVYNATGAYDAISFFWSPNPNGENGVGEDTLFEANAGSYNLIINDENGCSITLDFDLINPDSLYLVEFGYDPAVCRLFGYQNGNGVVFASAAGGTPDYDYEWTNLETGDVTDNTTWGGLNPGDYRITVVDENGCVLTDEITVDSLNPIADFDLTSPQFTTDYEGTATVDVHFVNTSSNFAIPDDPEADTAFFWYFGMGGSPVFSDDLFEEFDVSYSQAGTYTVCLSVSNKNGCTDSTCVDIVVYDPFLFTPVNVFTPNGDGNNDVFTFSEYAQSVGNFNCVILNRWGVVVAELNEIEAVWNGDLPGGAPAADGIYFYKYSGESHDGNTFEGQGNLHLMR